jgi:hypothetical protein
MSTSFTCGICGRTIQTLEELGNKDGTFGFIPVHKRCKEKEDREIRKEEDKKKREEWQRQEDSMTREAICRECGTRYRRSRDGGTPLCHACYKKAFPQLFRDI